LLDACVPKSNQRKTPEDQSWPLADILRVPTAAAASMNCSCLLKYG
jgi:hypothetical protein